MRFVKKLFGGIAMGWGRLLLFAAAALFGRFAGLSLF